MRVIQVMFDSLNRRALGAYGGNLKTPNFDRLANRAVTFDNMYVGSMPCMPARRELHTGRLNFLHRSWGPLEPFDDSAPQTLKEAGVYTHLCTDHQHYWEDGGATYHNRYSSYEFFRGQEGDLWKGEVADPEEPEHLGRWWRSDEINRKYLKTEADQPQTKTFDAGLEFIATNAGEDSWHLTIETFDPHEPFFTQQRYKDLYPHDYRGPRFDWPDYKPVTETDAQVAHARLEYAALVSMCDANLGRVLDAMDRHDLWRDTLLIVHADHGFMLGEHDCWAKCWAPYYNEVAQIPMFIWDPRRGVQGERRGALTQTIDLPATILGCFGIEPPPDMQGVDLAPVIAGEVDVVRDGALFGQHGAHVNCTDGRYVYMRAPVGAANDPLFDYTLMPTHMRQRFDPEELRDIELAGPFSFTKGCRVIKTRERAVWLFEKEPLQTLLFDLENDPGQERPIRDPDIEDRMADLMVGLMEANDAPPEQYERLGLVVG
ncbi:MAG: sulfatase [Planctomycetota bacterium]|jgi:arylsulfatase A-like enzyme